MDGTSARAALGLGPGADQHEVKQRYRLLAKDAHPDRGGDAARFDALTRAYEIACRTAPAGPQRHRFLLHLDSPPMPQPIEVRRRRRPRRPPVRSFAAELELALAG